MKYKNKLIELRAEHKLQQQQISEILGVQKDVYGHYEREETLISTKHLNTLCNFYETSFDYIFELSENKKYDKTSPDINIELCKERLKSFRKENKITQIKLAKILNTSQSTISAYEKGETLILASFLYAICQKYNISADYLLGKTNSPKYLK